MPDEITLKITYQQYRAIILALRSFCEEMQEWQATQPLCDSAELIRQSIAVREELIRQRDQQRRQATSVDNTH